MKLGFSQREYKEESHTKCCIRKEGCQESIKSTTIKLLLLTRLDYNQKHMLAKNIKRIECVSNKNSLQDLSSTFRQLWWCPEFIYLRNPLRWIAYQTSSLTNSFTALLPQHSLPMHSLPKHNLPKHSRRSAPTLHYCSPAAWLDRWGKMAA